MVNMIDSINGTPRGIPALGGHPRLIPTGLTVPQREDVVDFGGDGPVPVDQAMRMVVERSVEKLRAVVTQAREELGLPENAVIDTSPKATAGRIVDFALGAYDRYRENNKLEDTEEARAQFAEFIGGAINQGIAEARDILTALNSLTAEVDSNITLTADIIQERLADFVANGLSS